VTLAKIGQWKLPELLPDLKPKGIVVVWFALVALSALICGYVGFGLGIDLFWNEDARAGWDPSSASPGDLKVFLEYLIQPLFMIWFLSFPFAFGTVFYISLTSLSGHPPSDHERSLKAFQLAILWIITAAMLLQWIFNLYILSKMVVA
jgi:hypothetical protein